MPSWLGKSEGFAAIGSGMFVSLCVLLAFKVMTGDQFISAFSILVVSYFGGGALSAFRDMKKGTP